MLLKLCVVIAEGPSRSMEVSKNAALRCLQPTAICLIALLVMLRLLKTACVVVEKDIFSTPGNDGQADGLSFAVGQNYFRYQSHT